MNHPDTPPEGPLTPATTPQSYLLGFGEPYEMTPHETVRLVTHPTTILYPVALLSPSHLYGKVRLVSLSLNDVRGWTADTLLTGRFDFQALPPVWRGKLVPNDHLALTFRNETAEKVLFQAAIHCMGGYPLPPATGF